MQIKVLGSSAGGGFPQWNCHCRQCHGVRNGSIKATPRTQSSIAVKLHHQWALINASPDIHQQIAQNALAAYHEKIRENPFAAIILLDSQIDHTAGLLQLREDKPLVIYATENVFTNLTIDFSILEVLKHYCGVEPHVITIEKGDSFSINENENVIFYPIPLISNAPPYSPHRNKITPGDNIGLIIEDKKTGKKCFYAPGIGKVDEPLLALLSTVDCILIDGTAWYNDDLIRAGAGTTLATEMGHLPLSGEAGLIAQLDKLPNARKILVHINNTNPILDEESPERKILINHHIEVAYDGMEIIL